MRVLHVASEVFPFSRSGGLADVLGALPKMQLDFLQQQSPPSNNKGAAEVTVLSPWYAQLQEAQDILEIWRGHLPELAELLGTGPSSEVRLGEIRRDGVRYLFLWLEEFQRGGSLYHSDDVWRFSLFGRAALPVMRKIDALPEIWHGHDWQAALSVAYANLADIRSIFTVHNLQYQGRWNLQEGRYWTGLPDDYYNSAGLEFYGDLNSMKAGLCFADHITTVSPTYAQEITTMRYGYGLEGVLIERAFQQRLTGILNGIDQERWNPASDPLIAGYSTPEGKQKAVSALQKELKFAKNVPIMAVVSRLADQKGMDLLIESLDELTTHWQIAILGSGDPLLMAALRGWAQHPRVRYFEGMNEPLAHRLYAGAHAFVMPSRFEPCGLSQMIAMRYGTLPIVRLTGGLADTVPDNVGFRFEEASTTALISTCNEARQAYQYKAKWKERVARAMQLNHSWENSAEHYLELYNKVLGNSVVA